MHSAMFVPLVTQNHALGLAAFYRWGEQPLFDRNDLILATELVGRAAICMDNARRYLRECNSLVALQRSLLPRELPHHNGVEVAHEYVHAGAGGDWVEVVPLSGARVALVSGSVPGRGVHTAAAMGRLRAAVHTLSDLDLEPDELLARLDDLVHRLVGSEGTKDYDARDYGARDDTAGDRSPETALDGPEREEEPGLSPAGDDTGCSCLYVVYDPTSQCCFIAGAGAPDPVVALPDGTARALDLPASRPLGHPGPRSKRRNSNCPRVRRSRSTPPGCCRNSPANRAGPGSSACSPGRRTPCARPATC